MMYLESNTPSDLAFKLKIHMFMTRTQVSLKQSSDCSVLTRKQCNNVIYGLLETNYIKLCSTELSAGFFKTISAS